MAQNFPTGTVYGGSFVVSWSTGEIEVYGDADYRAKFTLPEGMQ